MYAGGKLLSTTTSSYRCYTIISGLYLNKAIGLSGAFSTTKSPHDAFKKARNLAFVRSWNKENTALFGKKLSVNNKGKLAVHAQEENLNYNQLISLDSSLPETNLHTQVPVYRPIDGQINDNHSHSNASGNESETSQRMITVPDVGSIVHFPLFVPVVGSVSEGDKPTEILALKEQRPVSVSQILNQTKSKESELVLKNWIKNQIATLGKERHFEAQKDRLRAASTFHGCLEQYLTGTPVHLLNLDEQVQPFWQSVGSMLQNIEEVLGVEVKVSHSKLKYHGTADCIAQYKGETCVVEWKTSSKPKASVSSLFDYPIQVAAYLGGLHYNADSDCDMSHVESMLIVVAYDDGSPAHIHYIPRHQSIQFWTNWCLRLHSYWKMKLSEGSDDSQRFI